jgi:transposase
MENVSEETYVGVDVHRKTVTATALDRYGRPLGQERFGSSDLELIAFLDRLPGTKHVALEACSVWEHFYDAAESTGATVTLSNPFKTRLIAEATIKTDKVDSEALARLLRLDALPTSYAPPPELRAPRSLVRERVFYRRKATQVMSHTYSVLLRRGIAYEDRILVHRRQRESLRDLHIEEVDRGLETLAALEATCKLLDRRIHESWASSEEAQLLSTIPGIGELTAIALVAYICPIERFPTSGQLSSYVGLAPTTHQSGEFAYHGRLKKDSVALLRWLLVEASWTHRHRCPRSGVARAARRVGRRRGKGIGTVAGAHSLLKMIHAMLKQREPFHPPVPRSSTAMQPLRRPRATAMQCVQRTTLEPSTADCLPAP